MESTQVLSEEDNLWLPINPYSNRGPVTNPAQFYGRRNDVLNIARSIKHWEPFALSGEPRTGKTSLLYYLVQAQGARTFPAFQNYVGNLSNYLFVLIELQRLPGKEAADFWRYLFDRLKQEARTQGVTKLEELSTSFADRVQDSDQYQIETSFVDCLKQLGKQVVFLFDDFDVLVKNLKKDVVQITDKLKTLKEALDLNDKINYIIISTDPLVRLFKADHILSISPLVSIILPLPPLGPLDKDAADALIQEPLRGSSVQFKACDMDFIYQLAGRYPDFIKITCYYLFAAYVQGDVDYSAVRQNIKDDPYVDLLMNKLWERLKVDEQLEHSPLQEVMLQIAQGQQPANMAAVRELRQRGLVDGSSSSLHIFGDLFCTFILNTTRSSHALEVVSSPVMTPPVNLTHLELKLYNVLAEHTGQACSRSQLQAAIWGKKLPNSPDALEQLVKRVRSKIEPDREHPQYLISIRGQGYLLRSEPAQPLQ